MTDVIVRALPSAAPDRGHFAEARRSLTAQGYDVDDDACERTLWITRALPVAVLTLADARADAPLDSSRLRRARCVIRGAHTRELLCVGVLEVGGDDLHVRFLDPAATDRPAVAIVSFVVERDGRDTPVVHRFVHGPR